MSLWGKAEGGRRNRGLTVLKLLKKERSMLVA
jgi:hypothetical protein